jgi:hypothetical protein
MKSTGKLDKNAGWPTPLQRAQFVEGALLFGLIILAYLNRSKSGPSIVVAVALVASACAYLIVGRAKRQWTQEGSAKPDLRVSILAIAISTLVTLASAAFLIFSK